ncbi:MAG: RNA polymerase sigma factor [Micromonosporaceae bacterium]
MTVPEAVERAYREHWGRLLALLTGQLGSLDVAEECLADAFSSALRAWTDGIPERPDAWLFTTARRRGIDLLRRAATLNRKLPLLVTEAAAATCDGSDEVSTIPDERLRLLFICCHPALAIQARVALTLRCVGGLTTPEVARAFLVAEPTMAARITRAKKKIAQAGIPYRTPTDAELPERLCGVLAVLYLIFTEGHAATSGDAPVRRDLAAEAIRLTRVLRGLMPDEPEVISLLALMLLHHARRDTRTDEAGRLVLLPDQDRTRWYAAEVAEGVELVRQAASRTGGRPGRYLLQAAIAAEHATAPDADRTDWPAIARLYRDLERLTGSPVVRLNHAVAAAEADGPEAGLSLLDGLDQALPRYHLVPAVRADLLRRLGRYDEAAEAYRAAIDLAGNDAERAFLRRRWDEVRAGRQR